MTGVATWVALAALLFSQPLSVRTEAKVEVSNGRSWGATTRYAGPSDAEYVQHRPEGDSRYTIASDGIWLTSPKGREPLDADLGLWILGHNFHAQILDFAAMNAGATRHPFVEPGCDCEELRGKRAAPAMGIEYYSLIFERVGGRARKLVIQRKDAVPVVSLYSDWRPVGGRSLPFAVDVDDGKDRYAFRFTSIIVE
ncbi:MAG: hypothetical protein V4808_00725 [Pseudomonadota bacterium]